MKNLLVLVFLVSFPSIYCQTSNENNNNLSGVLGIGGYFSNYSNGLALNIGANYLKNKNYWKLRLIWDYDINNFNIWGIKPKEQYYDIGILYGKLFNKKTYRAYISAGLGVLAGVKRGEFLYSSGLMGSSQYEAEHIFAPAIPLEIGLSSIPKKNIGGIGITGFVNLNIENILVGFIIKLEFGI